MLIYSCYSYFSNREKVMKTRTVFVIVKIVVLLSIPEVAKTYDVDEFREEVYDPDLAREAHLESSDLIQALISGKVTSKQEVLAGLRESNRQKRFFKQLGLLVHLNVDTEIKVGLREDLIMEITNQLLAEDNGPDDMNVPFWQVKPKFRPLYWLNLWSPGDHLFHHLWKSMKSKTELDQDSLFWILDFALQEDNVGIFRELWNHPSRQEFETYRIQNLLRYGNI